MHLDIPLGNVVGQSTRSMKASPSGTSRPIRPVIFVRPSPELAFSATSWWAAADARPMSAGGTGGRRRYPSRWKLSHSASVRAFAAHSACWRCSEPPSSEPEACCPAGSTPIAVAGRSIARAPARPAGGRGRISPDCYTILGQSGAKCTTSLVSCWSECVGRRSAGGDDGRRERGGSPAAASASGAAAGVK